MSAGHSSVILATAGYDHTIRFWEVGIDCVDRQALADRLAHSRHVLHQATTGICYRTLQYNDSAVNTLQIAADKSLLAAAGNPHIRLYEVNSNNAQPIVTYDGHASNVTAVGFEKNGTWMYSSSEDGTVKIWDLRAVRGIDRRAAASILSLTLSHSLTLSRARDAPSSAGPTAGIRTQGLGESRGAPPVQPTRAHIGRSAGQHQGLVGI